MSSSSLRVLFRDGVVVVAGEKLAAPHHDAQVFHQVERDFGRFARVLQLTAHSTSTRRARRWLRRAHDHDTQAARPPGTATPHSRFGRPRTRLVKVLFIGDIVGKPGREMIRKGLAAIVEHHGVDCVIANAENAAAGFRHHRGTSAMRCSAGAWT
jgi:hypothetical protein